MTWDINCSTILLLFLSAVPRTELIGEPVRFVKAGSGVVIRCVIRGALEPPSYVIWYFGAEQIFTENHLGWEMRTDEGDSQSTVSYSPVLSPVIACGGDVKATAGIAGNMCWGI